MGNKGRTLGSVASGQFEEKKAGTITVAPSGGDYTTIKDALAVAVARDVILVSPGIYAEDNPLTLVSNVTIKSTGCRNDTLPE